MNIIDVRKMSCPKPVIETKKFLDTNPLCASVCVVSDNGASAENVSRFLSNSGFEVTVENEGDIYKINGVKQGSTEADPRPVEKSEFEDTKTLIMITKDEMGSGDSILGKKLMKNFLATLNEYQGLWMVVFVNSGVKLTVKNCDTVEDISKLEKAGIKVLVCGTCLDHYNILEEKDAGQTTNMLDIIAGLNLADKVISM
ncbi:MAG: sulfurtransferase-like selenium metabolism protein YedF [Desulfobacteraceae bacterium]|nr:sulfurtransferase-like selenium metabolism protein YedF [Desulfobacteraceae bacterium]